MCVCVCVCVLSIYLYSIQFQLHFPGSTARIHTKQDLDRFGLTLQEIGDIDLSQIDPTAKRERVKCPRCEKDVLEEDMASHMTAHSSEAWPNNSYLVLRNSQTTLTLAVTHCSAWTLNDAKYVRVLDECFGQLCASVLRVRRVFSAKLPMQLRRFFHGYSWADLRCKRVLLLQFFEDDLALAVCQTGT